MLLQQACQHLSRILVGAGKLNSNGSELLVFGKQFGKIFIGVQPTFGYEGDPMRLLFSRSASPHHGFAAYYTFLEKIFKVRHTLLPACSSWASSDGTFAGPDDRFSLCRAAGFARVVASVLLLARTVFR